MICTGYIHLRVRHGDDPEGKNEILINALVSPSMREDAILCYNNLIRLKVLPPQFPGLLNSSQSRAVCTEATAGKDSIKKVIADFPDVFDSKKLSPIKGEPMKIHVNWDPPVTGPYKWSSRGEQPYASWIPTVTLRWFIDSDVIEPVDIREPTEWCSPGLLRAQASLSQCQTRSQLLGDQ